MYIMKDVKKFGWSVFTQYNATQRFEDPVRSSLAECALGQVFVGMNLFGPSKHFLLKGRELAEKTRRSLCEGNQSFSARWVLYDA